MQVTITTFYSRRLGRTDTIISHWPDEMSRHDIIVMLSKYVNKEATFEERQVDGNDSVNITLFTDKQLAAIAMGQPADVVAPHAVKKKSPVF